MYSCGYGTPALCEDENLSIEKLTQFSPSKLGKPEMCIRHFDCGSEHTVISCENDRKCENEANADSETPASRGNCSLYNFGGNQYFHEVPTLRMTYKHLFSCNEQGNAAIAYELNSESESNALYLWKNDAEGEIYNIQENPDVHKQIIQPEITRRGVRDGIAESVSHLKRRRSTYTMMPVTPESDALSHKGDGISNFSSNIVGSFKQVACGDRSILFLTDDGRVYSTGSDDGTLQTLAMSDGASKSRLRRVLFPSSDLIEDVKCIKIANGGQHFAALCEDGRLYMWGCNQHDQVCPRVTRNQVKLDSKCSTFCMNDARTYVSDPIEVLLKDDFRVKRACGIDIKMGIQVFIHDIACGKMHTTALTAGGQVYTWGRVPGAQDHNPAYPFPDLVGQYVVKIGSAPMYSIAVIQRPRLKVDARVIDGNLEKESWRKMLDCKRAKFGKQSNFSSMYLSVENVKYSNIKNTSCAGKAILVYRPYGGFPEDTSFGAIAHEACKAGAEMVIFVAKEFLEKKIEPCEPRSNTVVP